MRELRVSVFRIAIVFGVLVWTRSAPGRQTAPDLVLHGGRILAVGGDREILALAGSPTRKIDLKGRAVIPGLIDAAYAAFEENVNGSLEPGKLADPIVLSRDNMKIEPAEILKTNFNLTLPAGRIVCQK